MTADLTRWNRAGLSRFRYVDGNAATHLELIRERLAATFADWPAIAVAPDVSLASRLERIEEQYAAPQRDLGWEIARSYARACHVLTEHLDAYANEGYLGTATQWESVRRLVEMLDYHPAPPASASTSLVLHIKEGKSGEVAAGFQVQHVPEGGGDPVIFETLEDTYVDDMLNVLRLRGYDRSPKPAFGSTLTIATAKEDLIIGQPVVIENEQTGLTEARLIAGAVVGETTTIITLHQPILESSGFRRGTTLIHLEPTDVLDAIGPLSGGATLGEGVYLTEVPTQLRPGQIVYISDGVHTYYRRVKTIRDMLVVVDDDIGPLTTKSAHLSRARSIGVRSHGNRIGAFSFLQVVGDYSGLTGEFVADLKTTGQLKELIPFMVSSAIYEPVDPEAPEGGGFTMLKLDDPDNRLQNAQNLWIPSVTRDWDVDSFLAPANPLPTDLIASSPKKTSAGDLVVAVSGKQLAWAKATNVAVDDEEGTATITVQKWRNRAGNPFFPASTTVYGHFKNMSRLEAWDVNDSPASGNVLLLDRLPATLSQDRRLLITNGLQMVDVRIREVISASNSIVISSALPGGSTVSNTIVYGNVVPAGHGAAKPAKVLGSGDATALGQKFVLEQVGVSFVADPTFPTGVRADITVTVDGRSWKQVPTLNDSGHADSHYAIRMTEEGYIALEFGDGEHGRRVPTGSNNARVTFRVGTGRNGNLPAGSLTSPVRPHRLVAEVNQPLPATGGNDMEPIESMRINAPSTVLTLQRAVSLADYSSLAASQSSVWQARAFALPTGYTRQANVRVVVVPSGGGELGDLQTSLTEFLTAHGEPEVGIEVVKYRSRTVDVAVTVNVQSAAFVPDVVVAGVRSALLSEFSLEKRRLGNDMFLSEVIQVVESVEGVKNSICILRDGGVAMPRVGADPDEVIHIDTAQSALTVDWKEAAL